MIKVANNLNCLKFSCLHSCSIRWHGFSVAIVTLFFVVINYVSEYQKTHFSLFIRCSDIILSKLVWGRISGDPSYLKRRCHEIFDNLFLLKKFRVFLFKKVSKISWHCPFKSKFRCITNIICVWKSSVLGQVLYGCIVYERVIIEKYANISLLVPQFLIAAELQSCRVFKVNSTKYYFCSNWMLI